MQAGAFIFSLSSRFSAAATFSIKQWPLTLGFWDQPTHGGKFRIGSAQRIGANRTPRLFSFASSVVRTTDTPFRSV